MSMPERMGRRAALATLAAALLAPVRARGESKVARVGLLSAGRSPSLIEAWLTRALHGMGWSEGTLVWERRFAEGRPERLEALAAELVRLPVDAIVAPFNLEVQAARRATSTIPILMVLGGDPVGAGLVESLARPGGNITGTTYQSPEFAGKMIETLREALPHARRLTVIFEPDMPGMSAYLRQSEIAARRFGLATSSIEIRRGADVDAGLARIDSHRPDALFVVATAIIGTRLADIVRFVTARKLPAIYTARSAVEAGGLLSYGLNLDDLYRRAASSLDRILKGTRPGDLPIEQPTRFDLVINRKAARAIGITIPSALLLRADSIID